MLHGTPFRPSARIPLGELVAEPGEVFFACAGIGDNVVGVVGVLGDHGVVNDAAMRVEEHGKRGRIGREGRER